MEGTAAPGQFPSSQGSVRDCLAQAGTGPTHYYLQVRFTDEKQVNDNKPESSQCEYGRGGRPCYLPWHIISDSDGQGMFT